MMINIIEDSSVGSVCLPVSGPISIIKLVTNGNGYLFRQIKVTTDSVPFQVVINFHNAPTVTSNGRFTIIEQSYCTNTLS